MQRLSVSFEHSNIGNVMLSVFHLLFQFAIGSFWLMESFR